jgi:trans-aconitate methyltransferase
MPSSQQVHWGTGDAYERYMGRWSRKVAPLFTTWIGASSGAEWIDIGCGTGILTTAILDHCRPARIAAVDRSAAFLEAARERIVDPRVSFREGDAQAVPEDDGSFDLAVSGLLLNFLPDKDAAIAEMIRLVRPGGTVALYVWDYAGHMQMMRHFFDAAGTFDPKAREFDDGVREPVCRPSPLRNLLQRSGLHDVDVRPLDIPMAFESFDDYWTPFLGGTGSAPTYCASLAPEARERLRHALSRRLPTGPDGEILLAARAWAVKGRVAGA